MRLATLLSTFRAHHIENETEDLQVEDRLAVRLFHPPERRPRALLIESAHSADQGGYAWLADAMASGGYTVATYDRRGHGRSPGPTGTDLDSLPSLYHLQTGTLHDDARLVLDLLWRQIGPGKRRMAVAGHSLGAIMAATLPDPRLFARVAIQPAHPIFY
ncbi:MAG: alpha/beta fold hydrolase, partial [Euryarchaeota archaeon]|nr:alpha/beta fold hydrolase [Euryarchaeota archaeon]